MLRAITKKLAVRARLGLTYTTLRASLSVGAVLLMALLGTGFVSSAYERERTKLGDRHFRAGLRLTAVGDLGGAAEEFRKALLFSPDTQEYRLSLSAALLSSGKLDEAASHLEQLAQENPTDGHINLLLARVALREHRQDQALESYQRAVYEYWPPDELDKRREARWELIALLEQTGTHRNQLVGELLQLYGNLPPTSSQRLRVGEALLRNGADSEAAHVFHDILLSKTVKKASDTTAAHLGLAQVALRAGDFVEARHEYQHVTRDNPKDGEAAAALAQVNDLIEIAPELPNIPAVERVRRSQNLLNHVEGNLRQCASAETKPMLDQRLEQVKAETTHSPLSTEDRANALQQLARDLWKDRGSFCQQPGSRDFLLEAVLPRLNHE